jgi:hypothetical protein
VIGEIIRRLTRPAFVAPSIVEAIAADHQPPELTAKALTERIELPLIWSEQKKSGRNRRSLQPRYFHISAQTVAPNLPMETFAANRASSTEK